MASMALSLLTYLFRQPQTLPSKPIAVDNFRHLPGAVPSAPCAARRTKDTRRSE